MMAIVHAVRPLNPPYYHREYSNDIDRSHKEPSNIYKRAALVALPFLSLHTSLRLPISFGMGTVRWFASTNQLASDIQSRNYKKISIGVLRTIIAIAALSFTIFDHPIGMVVTTAHDIIFELSDLIQFLQKKEWEALLISLTKIVNNAFYLALICRGGLELSIASFAVQVITLVISSRDEFKKGHILEGYGNLLMAAVRMTQGYSRCKLLQRQWEITEAVKRIIVDKLHEKWQFPSDHLPVGIEVNGIKIINWNVLNNAYLESITTKDSQGLNGPMISDLDRVIEPNGLTQRDLIVVDMVVSMMNFGQVVALQKCGAPFLEALQERLPSHWRMVKGFATPRRAQDVVLFDNSRLAYRSDESEVTKDS